MWRRVKKMGINVPWEVVRHALLILDPTRVQRRKRRRLLRRKYINPGPNFCWHVDGYDKLKPFGFAIHGAIDGFSRRIMWLEVGPSNNNPMVVASCYLETIQHTKTVPCTMRCDLGTDNAHIALLQPYFTRHCPAPFGGEASFMYGKSTANQRIEAWWSMMRRQGADYWINLFKDMQDSGVLNTHKPIHIKVMRFAFMNLLQRELHTMAIEWNLHLIHSKPNAEVPKGKPDVLYYLPERYGTHSHDVDINYEVERFLFNIETQGLVPPDFDDDFLRNINERLPNWQEPGNAIDALWLFSDNIDIFPDP